MRSTNLLLAICIAGSLLSSAAEAQTDWKKSGTSGSYVSPKGTVATPPGPAPAKMVPRPQTTTAPRPVSAAAPLTAAECRGLGGKVEANVVCAISGSPDQCVTVDAHGVVRKKCLSRN